MNVLIAMLFDQDFDALNNMIRWNSTTRIKDETVAHHSYWVALYTRMLAAELNIQDRDRILDMVDYAILHDADEMFTGDVLHGVKYNSINGQKMRELLDEYIDDRIEEKFVKDNTAFFGTESGAYFATVMGHKNVTHVDKMIVKIADWLALIQYVLKEMKLGNREMGKRLQYACEGLSAKVNEIEDYCEKEKLNTKILNNFKDSRELYETLKSFVR